GPAKVRRNCDTRHRKKQATASAECGSARVIFRRGRRDWNAERVALPNPNGDTAEQLEAIRLSGLPSRRHRAHATTLEAGVEGQPTVSELGGDRRRVAGNRAPDAPFDALRIHEVANGHGCVRTQEA